MSRNVWAAMLSRHSVRKLPPLKTGTQTLIETLMCAFFDRAERTQAARATQSLVLKGATLLTQNAASRCGVAKSLARGVGPGGQGRQGEDIERRLAASRQAKGDRNRTANGRVLQLAI